MVSGAARSGPSKAFALVVALTWVGSVGGSTSSASVFSFDMGKRHESISVLDKCTVAFKDFGDDYQSVLLKPAVSPGSSSYVEFLIEDQAEAQATPQAPPPTPGPAPRRIMDPSSAACFMGFGVCKGTHEFKEGRSAMAADDAWMLSTQSGKVYSNGGQDTQFLPGVGTIPFQPGDEPLARTSVRPREGDRVGLLVDRSDASGSGHLSVFVNGAPM
ncbi:hypothetical protein T484DRAFT_1884276, partial [Baffinella frigidus]